MDATSIAAIATVALVVVTIAYTYATLRAYQEMKRTRLEAIRPALQVSPDVFVVNVPQARITNVGRGNALNVVANLRMKERDVVTWTFEWRAALLAPGASKAFMPKHEVDGAQPSVEHFVKIGRVFEFDAKFQDAFGRPYTSAGRADWTDVKEHLWGAQAVREEPELGEIVRHLEHIDKHLKGLVDPFDGVKVTTYRERQQRDRETIAALERQPEDAPGTADNPGDQATRESP